MQLHRTLFLSVLFLLARTALSTPTFAVTVGSDASYTVSVNNAVWLQSSSTFVTVNGKTYSSSEGTLSLRNNTIHFGSDTGGAYTRHDLIWLAGSYIWTTFIKVYGHHAVFGQVCMKWPFALAGGLFSFQYIYIYMCVCVCVMCECECMHVCMYL